MTEFESAADPADIVAYVLAWLGWCTGKYGAE